MNCTESRQRHSALLDGEGPAREDEALKRHLARCPGCRQALRELQNLSSSLRGCADYFSAPAQLRSRVLGRIRAENRRAAAALQPARGDRTWTWLFALPRWPAGATGWMGSMAAALLAFGLGLQLAQPTVDDRLLEQATANHSRALLTERALDLASSDQRTVGPWLAGRLDFSPPVRDLAATGFVLEGARLDYLDQRRVAVVVYRGRQQGIDLFMWPVAQGSQGLSRMARQRRGYSVVRWSEGGINYCAVSGAEPAELARLEQSMRARTPA